MSHSERVTQAAEAVLIRDKIIGPLDLLQELGFLQGVHFKEWKLGKVDCLEDQIHCGEKKLADTYRIFEAWLRARQLERLELQYQAPTRTTNSDLKIVRDGNPLREAFFRTGYRDPNLSDTKKKSLERKLAKPPDLVVFQSVSEDSNCSECGTAIEKGDMLFLEKKQALCLNCADLDHLEFLPSGDATLTRRSRKLSPLSAVVVRFNRSRKRYERQGILVSSQSIAQAEAANESDAELRAKMRAKATERRSQEDQRLVEEIVLVIRKDFPICPTSEAHSIAEHTALRGSGRVGRSAAGRAASTQSVHLAVRAWIRHQHTDYDNLLMQGVERMSARAQIDASLTEKADEWAGEM